MSKKKDTALKKRNQRESEGAHCQSFLLQPTTATRFTSALTFSDTMQTEIISSKYVDFITLLKENTPQYRIQLDGNGTTNLIQIDSVKKWLRAFCSYMSVYLKAHPEKSVAAVAHMYNVLEASEDYEWSAVYQYDINLRKEIKKDTQRARVKYSQPFAKLLNHPLATIM